MLGKSLVKEARKSSRQHCRLSFCTVPCTVPCKTSLQKHCRLNFCTVFVQNLRRAGWSTKIGRCGQLATLEGGHVEAPLLQREEKVRLKKKNRKRKTEK